MPGMQVKFNDGLFSREDEDSLEHVLGELVSDGREGLWREAPDEIHIRRRIAGGRSGAAVLEAVVIRGNARSRTVIKIGPFYALRDEFAAFREHLTVDVRGPRFVPIETVTQRLLAASPPTLAGELEAVVYSHAEYFHGVDEKPLRTFEEISHEYVHGGDGVTDETLTQLIARLFDGTRNALYGRWTVAEDDRRLRPYWNRPLGFDAVVAISAIDVGQMQLTSADAVRAADVLHERRFQETSVASDPPQGPVAVRFNHVRLQWWGSKLIGEIDAPYFLRFEIVGAPTPIEYLPERANITDGSQWRVHGVVRSWRTPESRQRLLHFLGAGFSLADGVLAGPDDARAPDPFACLGRVMDLVFTHIFPHAA